jgi:copper(I)-binding protein
VTLAAIVASAVLAAGCGTGLQAQTYKEKGRRDGATATVGGREGVAVQRLHVTGPRTGSAFAVGDSAFVAGGLINNASTADALVGATSDVSPAVSLLVDGSPVQQVDLPADGAAPAGWSLQLTSLTRAVPAGTYIAVDLQFQHAGKVSLQVPVDAGDNGLSTRTADEDPYKAG